MTTRLDQQQLLTRDEVVAAPVLAETLADAALSEGCTDRNFGLPAPVLLGMFGLFMAYLAVMSIGFMADGLVLPMAINVIFVAAFCIVPAKWATMGPARAGKAPGWAEFKARGIATETGRSGAGEATTLVLLLPACVFAWGIAVTLIARLV